MDEELAEMLSLQQLSSFRTGLIALVDIKEPRRAITIITIAIITRLRSGFRRQLVMREQRRPHDLDRLMVTHEPGENTAAEFVERLRERARDQVTVGVRIVEGDAERPIRPA